MDVNSVLIRARTLKSPETPLGNKIPSFTENLPCVLNSVSKANKTEVIPYNKINPVAKVQMRVDTSRSSRR